MKRTLFSILISVSLILSGFGLISADDLPENTFGTYVENEKDPYGKVLLRIAPGVNGDIAKSVNNGTPVEVLDHMKKDSIEWTKIRIVENGSEAWTESRWVLGTPVKTPAPPKPETYLENAADPYGKVMLRLEPGTRGAAGKSVNNGTAVIVIDSAYKNYIDWLKIRIIDDGFEGWTEKRWVHGNLSIVADKADEPLKDGVYLNNDADPYGKVIMQVKPGLNGDVSRAVNNGTSVDVLDKESKDYITWIKVKTIEGGYEGWVQERWVFGMENVEPVEETISESEEVTDIRLDKQFPLAKIREQFYTKYPTEFYRSPVNWFYDPLDLSYFPHETVDERDWILLERFYDGHTYQQRLYRDAKDTGESVIHGTAADGYGYLKDFYVYADLFITDDYPENSGGCYFYYSDSILSKTATNKNSYGIMIDPEKGVYKSKNKYGYDYWHYGFDYSHTLIRSLDPSLYADKTGSFGNDIFTASALDKQFNDDYEFLKKQAEMNGGHTVRAYRIELVRLKGITKLYINGEYITDIEDGDLIQNSACWSFGPILSERGETVTCAIGTLLVQGK